MDHIVIALKLHEKQNHSVLQTFAQLIHDGMVAQVGVYPTPTPLMSVFLTQINLYSTYITACGTPANKGPHVAFTNRDAQAEVIKDSLRHIQSYCQTATPNDEAHFQLVGFETVTLGHQAPVGVLPAPANLRSKITATTLSGETPLDCDPVHGAETYSWYGAATPTDPFVFLANTTKSSYIVVGTPGRTGYFTVKANGAAGAGVETAPLQAHSQF